MGKDCGSAHARFYQYGANKSHKILLCCHEKCSHHACPIKVSGNICTETRREGTWLEVSESKSSWQVGQAKGLQRGHFKISHLNQQRQRRTVPRLYSRSVSLSLAVKHAASSGCWTLISNLFFYSTARTNIARCPLLIRTCQGFNNDLKWLTACLTWLLIETWTVNHTRKFRLPL